MGFDHGGDEGVAQLPRTASTGVLAPRTAEACSTSETGQPGDKRGRVVSSSPFEGASPVLPPLCESQVPATQR